MSYLRLQHLYCHALEKLLSLMRFKNSRKVHQNMHSLRSQFQEKLFETLKAVVPILIIVLLLCFTITPIPPSILLTFLVGAVMLIIGMLFFNVVWSFP